MCIFRSTNTKYTYMYAYRIRSYLYILSGHLYHCRYINKYLK